MFVSSVCYFDVLVLECFCICVKICVWFIRFCGGGWVCMGDDGVEICVIMLWGWCVWLLFMLSFWFFWRRGIFGGFVLLNDVFWVCEEKFWVCWMCCCSCGCGMEIFFNFFCCIFRFVLFMLCCWLLLLMVLWIVVGDGVVLGEVWCCCWFNWCGVVV